MAQKTARIAVAGAGLIGSRHIQLVACNPNTEVAGVVEVAGSVQKRLAGGCKVYASLEELVDADMPDGIIIATPTRLHVPQALYCVQRGIPTLVEKPLGETVETARVLVETAERKGVPLMVGHHRRHSAILAAAEELIKAGGLGDIVAVQGSAAFYKPPEYFERAPWRGVRGEGGPLLTNLSHEIDALRMLCGEIVSVQATAANAVRGRPVEETVALTLAFASSALGVFLLSDAAASARSWELTSGEDPRYPHYGDENCYEISGTRGSLAVPSMRVKRFRSKQSWLEPFDCDVIAVEQVDPLKQQLEHFRRVICKEVEPLTDARDGLQTLRVVDAVARAITAGCRVEVGLGDDEGRSMGDGALTSLTEAAAAGPTTCERSGQP